MWFRRRALVWRQILFRPVWGVLALIYGILQFVQFIRGELPKRYQEMFSLLSLLPNWPWWGWTIGWLVFLFVVVLEGAYRVVAARDGRIRQLETTSNDQASLAIEYAPEPPMLTPQIYSVRIGNNGPAHGEDVKVKIRRVNPLPSARWAYRLPAQLVQMHATPGHPCRIPATSEEYFLVVGNVRTGTAFIIDSTNVDGGHADFKLEQCYIVELEASAANAPVVRRTFQLDKHLGDDGRVVLRFFPDEESPPITGVVLSDLENPAFARQSRRNQAKNSLRTVIGFDGTQTAMTGAQIEALSEAQQQELFTRNPGLREWCAGEPETL